MHAASAGTALLRPAPNINDIDELLASLGPLLLALSSAADGPGADVRRLALDAGWLLLDFATRS